MPAATTTIKFAQGLDKTLELLSKTTNEAAIETLVPALDSAHQVIQDGALRAVLERRSPVGQREVLSRLDTAGPNWRDIIEINKGRMTHALRDGVLGTDPRLCVNACQAILWFREYDLVPALLTALEDDANPRGGLAADTLEKLADLLFEDIAASPRDYTGRRDPQLIHQRVVGSLEASVRRFGQHERPEVVNAFLLLTHRDNVTLKQVLQDPQHGTFVSLIDALLHNQRSGVIQLLLSFLDDLHAPTAAISVLARRRDRKFMTALLRRAEHPFSHVAADNLKRVESFAWLHVDPAELDKLDDDAQNALVQLTVASGMRRDDVFKIIEYLLVSGKPLGRIAAAEALAHFNNSEANSLVTRALTDHEPRVQAAVLRQLRQRGTPGALARLVEMVESPEECVRVAARESLSEFSFDRYLAAFDLLDEDVRRTTGSLVRKVNPEAVVKLAAELRAHSRMRRLKALSIAESMGVIPRLEPVMLELLADDDHLVRSEAARALAQCNSAAARQALERALTDRSIAVQEAAQSALESLETAAIQNQGGRKA